MGGVAWDGQNLGSLFGPPSMEEMVQAAVASFGHVDVVVPCAYYTHRCFRLLSMSLEKFEFGLEGRLQITFQR